MKRKKLLPNPFLCNPQKQLISIQMVIGVRQKIVCAIFNGTEILNFFSVHAERFFVQICQSKGLNIRLTYTISQLLEHFLEYITRATLIHKHYYIYSIIYTKGSFSIINSTTLNIISDYHKKMEKKHQKESLSLILEIRL